MAAAPFPTTAVCDTGKDAVQLLLGIRALDPAMCVQGPAYPIQLPPGDNLDFRTAMDAIPAGSVVVLEAGGALDRAVTGEVHYADCGYNIISTPELEALKLYEVVDIPESPSKAAE